MKLITNDGWHSFNCLRYKQQSNFLKSLLQSAHTPPPFTDDKFKHQTEDTKMPAVLCIISSLGIVIPYAVRNHSYQTKLK